MGTQRKGRQKKARTRLGSSWPAFLQNRSHPGPVKLDAGPDWWIVGKLELSLLFVAGCFEGGVFTVDVYCAADTRLKHCTRASADLSNSCKMRGERPRLSKDRTCAVTSPRQAIVPAS